jgi:hypothetical protein
MDVDFQIVEDINKANSKRRQAENQSNLSDLQSEVSDVEKVKRRLQIFLSHLFWVHTRQRFPYSVD